ncbi:carboxypeptidase regulatory-like domain-containing protein [Persicobacter psychrovividus]|uniref:TolB protein n=1 Tax=Persicobacter psychrovividus TaxID=387638 RepID=A0ABN6L763_9BACT|nr:hypothetical protein PEPS_12340 [Persicobacter psychrovividus]
MKTVIFSGSFWPKQMSALGLLILSCLLMLGCQDVPVEPDLTGALQGQVFDNDRQPIEGVSVSTTPASSATITDASGQFFIERLAVGEYVLNLYKSGYKGRAVNVAVRADEQQVIQVVMEEKDEEDEDLNLVMPYAPQPTDGASGVAVQFDLAWGADTLNAEGTTYNLIIYQGSQEEVYDQRLGLTDTTYSFDGFAGQQYFWQVTTIRGDHERQGPLWHFSTVSNTNARFVFTRKTNKGNELFAGDPNSLATIQLTNSGLGVHWPRINPKNDLVAFSALEDGRWQLFLTDLSGATPKKLTTLPMGSYHNFGGGFCWSADGKYLLYPVYDKLYRIDYNGSGLTQLATAPADRHFAEVEWAPNSSKLVCRVVGNAIGDDELYLMNTNGSGQELLIGDATGTLGSPTFSVDSKKVWYTRDKSGHDAADGRQLDASIFSIDLSSKQITALETEKPSGFNDHHPRLSPSGANIIFQSGPNNFGAATQIYIAGEKSEDTDNRTLLFADAAMPDWR